MTSSVPAAFATAVARFAARPAILGEDGSRLSYQALDDLRQRAARALLARGIQAGDRVAIWAPNRSEWIVAALAIQAVGAVLVPINTRMKGSEAAFVLEKSRTRLLFCAGRWLGQDYPQLLAGHRPPTLEWVVTLDDCDSASLQATDSSWSAFMDGAAGSSLLALEERSAALTGDSQLDILFTSGTTGLPKGVVTSHGQNLRVSLAWGQRMALVPEDVYLLVNPFFHAFGYKAGWLTALLHGCVILPQAVFDPARVMQRIAKDRVSVLPGPPTLFIALMNAPEHATADYSSLRASITGAATVAPALIERMRAELGFKILLTGYGLTEACGMVSFCFPGDDAETVARTCGRPLPGTEVKCVDDDGRDVPTGEAGELLVRGYNVMQGYLDDPEATAATITRDGWLRTGDVAVIDAAGYIRITDRLKDMYIHGGFNCYPAEIERMMSAHPAVAQVAVIGVPDERQGEVGKAFVTLRPGQTADEAGLIAWCRGQMANYKVPRSIEVLDQLPTNAAGKVTKYELRRRVAGNPSLTPA